MNDPKIKNNYIKYPEYDPNKKYNRLPGNQCDRINNTWYINRANEPRLWAGGCLRTLKTIHKGRGRRTTGETKRKDQIARIHRNYEKTEKQYLEMFVIPGCDICNKPLQPYTKDANIDHEPGTGRQKIQGKMIKTGIPTNVRGILCTRCNHAMSFVDDTDWLAKAISYREDNKRKRED